jgi:hypothetical protein
MKGIRIGAKNRIRTTMRSHFRSDFMFLLPPSQPCDMLLYADLVGLPHMNDYVSLFVSFVDIPVSLHNLF